MPAGGRLAALSTKVKDAQERLARARNEQLEAENQVFRPRRSLAPRLHAVTSPQRRPSRLFGFGYNGFGQVGVADQGSVVSKPLRIELLLDGGKEGAVGVASVACGGAHTLTATSAGGVQGWGRCNASQLGRVTGSVDGRCPLPTRIMLPTAVDEVACGFEHSAARTRDGRVFTWGRSDRGQLGHGIADDAKPTRAQEPTEVGQNLLGRVCVRISCGFAFTAVVTSDGELWCFGDNEHGQLGVAGDSFVAEPALASSHGVVDVACGDLHLLCLRRVVRGAGDIRGLGYDTYVGSCGLAALGRLGRHDSGKSGLGDIVELQRMGLTHLCRVAAGGACSAVLTMRGGCYVWGYGGRGALGGAASEFHRRRAIGGNNDSDENEFVATPTALYLPKEAGKGASVACISFGEDHAIVASTRGEVFALGWDSSGRLGVGEEKLATSDGYFRGPLPLTYDGDEEVLKRSIVVACGSAHSIMGAVSASASPLEVKSCNISCSTLQRDAALVLHAWWQRLSRRQWRPNR